MKPCTYEDRKKSEFHMYLVSESVEDEEGVILELFLIRNLPLERRLHIPGERVVVNLE